MGSGVGRDETQFELDPELVGIATGDPSSNRWFLIVADDDPVARLSVEGCVGRTGAVADRRLDHEVGSNRLGVVPQVVAIALQVAQCTSATPGSIARVGDRAIWW